MNTSRRTALGMTLGLCGWLASPAGWAEDYPSKVVKLIVPYPPGGVVDITGRQLADQLSQVLGGRVIVENKPGAGGTLGADQAARATPDGYTLLFSGAATHAFAPWIYKNLRYDPVADFVAITQLTAGPLALCVNAASPVKTLAEFLDWLKTGGATLSYASNGNGTFPHLAVELLKQVTGAKPLHIPYPGGGQALTALLAGEVGFSLNHIPVVLPHVTGGRLRVLATSGATRSGTFPDVPTLKESGLDVEASAWFGLYAPAGTPPDIVQRLAQATATAAATPALKQQLAAQGDEIVVEGPDTFLAYQKGELAKWRTVIESSGMKLQ